MLNPDGLSSRCETQNAEADKGPTGVGFPFPTLDAPRFPIGRQEFVRGESSLLWFSGALLVHVSIYACAAQLAEELGGQFPQTSGTKSMPSSKPITLARVVRLTQPSWWDEE